MPGAAEFFTISDAVERALDEWHASGVFVGDMEMMVDEFVQKGITEWLGTPAADLPVLVSASEAQTISGAVLNAFADWHSGGEVDAEEMSSMAEDFALSAVEEWKSSHGFGEDDQAAP